MFVITWDNGSGYREHCSQPQPTVAAAWRAAGIQPGQYPQEIPKATLAGGGWCVNYQVKQVASLPADPNDRLCTCGSGEPWVSCGEKSQYCG